MADKNNCWEQNAVGALYVDRTCIACNACVEESPNFFKMNDDDQHAFVKKQPVTNDELANCLEAINSCPVEAIGLIELNHELNNLKVSS